MEKINKMLIDSTHPEETRVVVLRNGRVEEFDYESAARKLLRGNIYLAKVTRVEPSLQAAFVEYGGNRHGFLAFNEIHPDYYQIPVADREALKQEEAAIEAEEEARADARAEARANRGRRDERGDGDGTGNGRNRDDADQPSHDGHAHDDFRDAEAASGERQRNGDNEQHQEQRSPDDHDGDVHAPGHHEASPSHTHDAGPSLPLAHRIDAAVVSEAADDAGHRDNHHHEAEDHHAPHDDHDGGHDVEAADPSGHADNIVEVADQAEAPEILNSGDAAELGGEDAMEEVPDRPRRQRRRHYKIQEVIRRRQVILVQVVKEERGNKGAALTTYLSLAGRYTVLMPNTGRGGGISRKITNAQDRRQLKAIAQELEVPEGMGLIIRTAGAARTKQEIKRDYEYLMRLWESVRDMTLESTAPSLVYEEGNLIKRSIRDLYSKEIDEVVVAGDQAHREAHDFMRMLMPSHVKNVTNYAQPEPLFAKYRIEPQLNAMFSPHVTLKSGGYLVINQTEALVAIDVNSGKSTREFSIEETALNTNLEASEEIARQLKLRDLAGLIVIDFIDMEERRNNRKVENKLKDALRHDRARIQVGRISHFGLMEMSRQRLRTGVLEGSTSQCPHCQGTGIIRSTESVALAVIRGIEDHLMRDARSSVTAVTTAQVALYILNNKRSFITEMEDRFGLSVAVQSSDRMQGANFAIEKSAAPLLPKKPVQRAAVSMDWGFNGEETAGEHDPELEQDDRGGSHNVEEVPDDIDDRGDDGEQPTERGARDAGEPAESDGERRGRRRRRRRGRGRDRNGDGARPLPAGEGGADLGSAQSDLGDEPAHYADGNGMTADHVPDDHRGEDDGEPGAERSSEDVAGEGPETGPDGERKGRRRRRGRRGGRRRERGDEAVAVGTANQDFTGGDGDGVAGTDHVPSHDYADTTGDHHADAMPATVATQERTGVQEAVRHHPASDARGVAGAELDAGPAVTAPQLATAPKPVAAPPPVAQMVVENVPPRETARQAAPIEAPLPHADDPARPARKGWWQRRILGE